LTVLQWIMEFGKSCDLSPSESMSPLYCVNSTSHIRLSSV